MLHIQASARRVAPLFALLLTTLLLAHAAFAQSPNTATLIVAVVDQNGTAVPDAKVSLVNTATGDVRDAVTGHYRQFLFDGRVDHKLTSSQTLMFRVNVDRLFDDNP